MAYAHYKSKLYESALELYEEAKKETNAPEIDLNIAKCWRKLKLFWKAEEIFTKFLLQLPEDFTAKYYMGKLSLDREQYQHAIEWFLKSDTNNIKVNYRLAKSYTFVQQYENANKYYDFILKEDPGNIEYLLLRALSNYSMRRNKEGDTDISNVKSRLPTDVSAKAKIAFGYLQHYINGEHTKYHSLLKFIDQRHSEFLQNETSNEKIDRLAQMKKQFEEELKLINTHRASIEQISKYFVTPQSTKTQKKSCCSIF